MMRAPLGKIIKQLLVENNMSVADFANAIETTRENAYSILKRSSFDSELLWKMSAVLKHNLFKYFSEKFEQELNKKHLKPISKDVKNDVNKLSTEEVLLSEIKSLKREIELLKEINFLLKNKMK